MTLKNYKRPNGVATQIFNVNLIGYQPSLMSSQLVVATHNSTNKDLDKPTPSKSEEPKKAYGSQMQEIPEEDDNRRSIKGVPVQASLASMPTGMLSPAKLISVNTGEPPELVNAANFESGDNARKDVNALKGHNMAQN